MTNESIWDKVDSVEKRFENRLDKSNVKFNTLNPVWDNEKEDTLNVFEMIDELNYLNDCCNNLIEDNTEYVAEINQIHKENEELKEANNEKIEIIDCFLDEMELMREALREELQDNGNAYYIRIFDDLFDLEYDKWKRNEQYRECTDWEKILEEK